jgi:hypothetical protein
MYQVASWICGPNHMNDPAEAKSSGAQADREQTGLEKDFFVPAWERLVEELPRVSAD